MKKLLKPGAWVPIVIGLALGALLFAVGDAEDAPGMCAIGLSIAFVLAMLGLQNAGWIRRGLLLPIYLLCFGAGGALLSIVLLLDGELGAWPWLAAIGVAAGAAMIAWAAKILIGRKRRAQPQ